MSSPIAVSCLQPVSQDVQGHGQPGQLALKGRLPRCFRSASPLSFPYVDEMSSSFEPVRYLAPQSSTTTHRRHPS